MPQDLMILDEKAQKLTDEQLYDLNRRVTEAIEDVFDIKNRNDVGFTAINARLTRNEKNIQFNIGFTKGTAEYVKGIIFSPSIGQLELLAERIERVFTAFLADYGLSLTASVWFLPSEGGLFKIIA
jgi:hypothetical protein